MYAGETGSNLKERIKKLRSDCEKDKKKENITGLSQLMQATGHKPTIEDLKITPYRNNLKKIKFIEAVRITLHKKRSSNELKNKPKPFQIYGM